MAKRRLICTFLCFIAAAFAQRGRTEVRGDIGWTGFLDDGDQNHFLAGASLRAYLTSRVSFQPEFQYLRRSSNSSRSHYDLVLLANFAYDFRPPGSRVVPYFIIGPGIINTRESTFPSTAAFLSLGAGVKVFLNDRWYVAPDFRVGVEPHAHFSVGVGYILKP